MSKVPFKISSGLKNLIGRDLITSDFVAVFELVKNCFDAHATKVKIYIADDRILISDNGKGMSRADILEKWLFVAYSAKVDGTEDDNYRGKIRSKQSAFAGAKGVGRFSCDRLGEKLKLLSLAEEGVVTVLDVDWSAFEKDLKEEFGNVEVDITDETTIDKSRYHFVGPTGTALEITDLRLNEGDEPWPRKKIQQLKLELAKLIDPFGDKRKSFEIEVISPKERTADRRDEKYNNELPKDSTKPSEIIVNGLVENNIRNVLKDRTTAIEVAIVDDGEKLETTLYDRGELIYRIREKNKFDLLTSANAAASVFYLNTSAKNIFTRRMGVRSVDFGAVMVFRNGFRIFPIGAEKDDFFGINRRKQQGVSRYLGSRDLIGKVDIEGVEGFKEATSRNGGLIETPATDELRKFIITKCIRRLEKYVVDISWKDKFDNQTSDLSRIRLDNSSALIGGLVSGLASDKKVEIVEYNEQLVRIIDEKSDKFETSLKSLEVLAEKTGRSDLKKKIDETKARIKALEEAEAAAREAEKRERERALKAEETVEVSLKKLEEEKKRNKFLVSVGSMDKDTILNLHHQIIIQASNIENEVSLKIQQVRDKESISREEWEEFLDRISLSNRQILVASKFATKGDYKQQSSKIQADIVVFIEDYISEIASLWAPQGLIISTQSDNKEFVTEFSPIEVGMMLDNLISNSTKFRASEVLFKIYSEESKPVALTILVADDGNGIDNLEVEKGRIFEKGVTTTNGSGLGLFHVKQICANINGDISLRTEAFSEDLDGALFEIKVYK